MLKQGGSSWLQVTVRLSVLLTGRSTCYFNGRRQTDLTFGVTRAKEAIKQRKIADSEPFLAERTLFFLPFLMTEMRFESLRARLSTRSLEEGVFSARFTPPPLRALTPL